MDYEKYKEALERAKIWQKHLYEVGDKDYADELNYIFPELKESEGERIRKFLIEDIKDTLSSEDFKHYNPEHTKKLEEALAWLEKQGEQKSQRMISAMAKEAMYDKPAWSEEEEVKINRIVACLENLNVADNDILLKDVDWLKSLKDRMKGE